MCQSMGRFSAHYETGDPYLCAHCSCCCSMPSLPAPPPLPASRLEETPPEDLCSNGNSAHAEKEPSWTQGNLLKHSGFMSPISSQQSEAHRCDQCDGTGVCRRTQERAERSTFFDFDIYSLRLTCVPVTSWCSDEHVHHTQTVRRTFLRPFRSLAVLFGGLSRVDTAISHQQR